jgi:hypothetical protein
VFPGHFAASLLHITKPPFSAVFMLVSCVFCRSIATALSKSLSQQSKPFVDHQRHSHHVLINPGHTCIQNVPSSCYTLKGVDYPYSTRALLQKAKEAGAPQPVGNTLKHLAGELFLRPKQV